MTTSLKSDLSPARRRLIEVMQRLNFGRLENLIVANGEPVLDDSVGVVREVKFSGDNAPRQELTRPDFILKAQARELFEQFDALRDFTALSLTVKHGLPFHMEVAALACCPSSD
jgi:hypothetical protein